MLFSRFSFITPIQRMKLDAIDHKFTNTDADILNDIMESAIAAGEIAGENSQETAYSDLRSDVDSVQYDTKIGIRQIEKSIVMIRNIASKQKDSSVEESLEKIAESLEVALGEFEAIEDL